MTDESSIKAFGAELHALCNRYMNEFDIDRASVLGCLHIEAQVLVDEVLRAIEVAEDQEVIESDSDEDEEGE